MECVDSKKEYQEDDLAAVKEFIVFIVEIKKRFPGHDLAHQFSNYPEGLECKFRLARNSGSTGGCPNFTSSFFSGESSNNHDLADEQKKVAKKEKIKREKREVGRRKTQERKCVLPENCEERNGSSEFGKDKNEALDIKI